MRLDHLVLGENERGPGEDLALQFEAVNQFTEDEKQSVRELLEGMIPNHKARLWDASRAARLRQRHRRPVASGQCVRQDDRPLF